MILTWQPLVIVLWGPILTIHHGLIWLVLTTKSRLLKQKLVSKLVLFSDGLIKIGDTQNGERSGKIAILDLLYWCPKKLEIIIP